MPQSKRRQFSIEEKSRIISKLESGIPNKDLAKENGVSHSTISMIWKERHKIKTLYDANFLKMKRARTTKHTKIDEALLKWFKDQRANNVAVNCTILQQKANEFGKRFGEDFNCSYSWIQRFRVRHGIIRGHRRKKAKRNVSIDDGTGTTTEAENFTKVDTSFVNCEPTTEVNIVQEIKEETEEYDEKTEEPFIVPTLSEGLDAVNVLRQIFLFKEQFHIEGNYDGVLIKIQRELQNALFDKSVPDKLKLQTL